VYLLREAFGHDYAEIGRILDKTEINCRQILKRARERVAEGRPRFDASPAVRERIVQEFLAAVSGENMDGLMALLAPDVAFHSDGGGQASAVPSPSTASSQVSSYDHPLPGSNRGLFTAAGSKTRRSQQTPSNWAARWQVFGRKFS